MQSTDGWRPMTEHVFPWSHEKLIVVAFDKDDPPSIEIFCARVGEHGALFTQGTMLSLHEQRWIPFAWRIDDSPRRDDMAFPPLLTDYLTERDTW